MPLTLTLNSPENVPIEVEGITPDITRKLSTQDIAKLPVFVGNQARTVADLFAIDGDARDGEIHWRGDLRGVHWIGAKMASGRILVSGNAGRHVGSEMTGGRIDVHGDAGDWIGAEMRDGWIHVRGSAGHLIGAAYRGSARGMTGGTIVVEGTCGNEIGHSMRRGLIAIGGSVGDLVGFNMIAGTVVVAGDCGIRHGAGMRRGTIALWGQTTPEMLPTFTDGGFVDTPIVQLIQSHLFKVGYQLPEAPQRCRLFHGDMLEGGRGEILLRA